MYSVLTLEKKDGIGILTLNNPEKRNAMLPQLTKEFPEAIEQVRNDPEIKVLVITGTGKAFCAGGDLEMLQDKMGQSPEQNRREMCDFYRAYLSVLNLDVPTIAAINGHAIGAGLSFTLGCDIRLVAEHAKMGVTFLNLGLHPGMGTTHLLPQIVGSAHASDLILTGRLIKADEAKEMGLVSRVLPSESLLEEAINIASQVASKSASGTRMAKRALVRSKLEGLDAALDYEATAQMSSYSSVEMENALQVLIKK